MAYIVKNPDDQQQRKTQGAADYFGGLAGQIAAKNPVSAATTPTSGGGSPFSVLATAPTPNAHQGSGNFFNVQRLINANRGAGSQLADQMVAQADRATQNAQNQIGGVVDKFNTAAQVSVNGSSIPKPAQSVLNDPAWGTIVTRGGGPLGGGTTTTIGNPLPSDVANQYRNVAYTGPRTLADVDSYQGAQNAVQQAQQQANALTSYGGRQAMLDGGAGYGRGSKAFDVLLASNAGNHIFDQAKARADALNKLFSSAQNDATARIGNVDQQVNAFHNVAGQIDRGQADIANQTIAAEQARQQAAQQEADLRRTYDDTMGHQTFFDRGIVIGGGPTFEQWQAMSPEARAWYQQYGFTDPLRPYTGPGGWGR